VRECVCVCVCVCVSERESEARESRLASRVVHRVLVGC
jgi:hypothetical protein